MGVHLILWRGIYYEFCMFCILINFIIGIGINLACLTVHACKARFELISSGRRARSDLHTMAMWARLRVNHEILEAHILVELRSSSDRARLSKSFNFKFYRRNSTRSYYFVPNRRKPSVASEAQRDSYSDPRRNCPISDGQRLLDYQTFIPTIRNIF